MKKLKFSAAFCIAMLLLQGLYAQYTGQASINPVDLSYSQTNGYDVASIEGCHMEDRTGAPFLPIKTLSIAIPEDQDVASVQILGVQQQELPGTYNILPTQESQVPGEPAPDFINGDPDIYNVNAQYPAISISYSCHGFRSGVHLVHLQFYPLTYNPITQKLYLTTQIQYQLQYTNASHDPVKPRKMLQSSYLQLKETIKSRVENPAAIDTYLQPANIENFSGASFAPDEFPNINGQAVEYVIITNENLAGDFQEIADWKTKKGVPAVVRTVEWIYSYYPGVDQAEKVRNFIIDAYQNWGAHYIVLGGDIDVVPVRYAWMGTFCGHILSHNPSGPFIPADMYFACLDGNWNTDGDATFGEANWNRSNDGTFYKDDDDDINIDQVDREPEIYIGRIPVEDYQDINGEYTELKRFITKFFEYTKSSQGNENNCLLFSSMGSIASLKSSFSSNNNISFTELYNTTGHNNMDVLAAFNGTGSSAVNHHIMCGLGHGGPTNFAAADGDLYREDMDNLINADRSQILYLGNHCTTMPWNQNTVTEHYINSENGGVAVIANTYTALATYVSLYNLPFIKYLYENNNHIGISFRQLKNISSIKDSWARAGFFTLSLAADPEMPVWTDVPDPQNPLSLTVPSSVQTGPQAITIQLDNLSSGTEATLCLFRENEIYAVESLTGTGSTISTTINCTPDTEGTIDVTVTAKNFLPSETTIPVTANPGVHLYASNTIINDAATSPANGNGEADAGETLDMGIELSNSGLTSANGVNATLSYIDPSSNNYINITQSQSCFGNIPSQGTGISGTPFRLSIDPSCPDLYQATLELSITDNQSNTFTEQFYMEVHKAMPSLVLTEFTTSMGDPQTIDAGDHVSVDFIFFNQGTGLGTNINGALSTSSPFVTAITANNKPFGNIASHESGQNQGAFEFDVANNYNGESIVMELSLNGDLGQGPWDFPINFDQPPAVLNIGWESTDKSISLYWDPLMNGVKGYNVYKKINNNYEKINEQIIEGFSGFTDYDVEARTIYYYKVSSVSEAGIEGPLSNEVETWTSLPYHEGWPNISIDVDNYGHRSMGSPMTADIDADGYKEIFFTTKDGADQNCDHGAIFGFRHDGEEIYDLDINPTSYSGFYKFDQAGAKVCPAIADVNGDFVPDILCSTAGANNDGDRKRSFAFSSADTDDNGEPDPIWETEAWGWSSRGICIAELDNNEGFEAVAKARWGGPLKVMDAETGADIFNITGSNTGIGFGMPSVADINGDGSKEIIIGYQSNTNNGFEGGIYVYNSDGSSYIPGNNGMFFQESSTPGLYDRMDAPVSIGDINNDGYKEIVCVSSHNINGKPWANVFILDGNGNTIAGWGYTSHSFPITDLDFDNIVWSPTTAIGNLDSDPGLEVVIADKNKIYMYDHDGSNLISPIDVSFLEAKFISPLIADVDEDPEVEIIVTSTHPDKGGIHCFDLDGSRVLGWPLRVSGIAATPCIDDIDNDGKNEIIATKGTNVHVWDTEGDADKVEWGKFRHDQYNSGVYGDFCPYAATPKLITGTEDWTTPKTLDRGITLQSGAVLTIYKNVSLPAGAPIIVNAGAELIIDGARIGNACTDNWQGIQVRGSSSSSQNTLPSPQGQLTLLNGAIIENANIAIDMWEPNNASTAGAIVQADGAIFRNNTISVRAPEYRNYQAGNPSIELPNRSYFRDCSFEITDGYHASNEFENHVYMWGNNGIDFEGCSFTLDPNATDISPKNYGIRSLNCEYSVLPIDLGGWNNYNKTNFNNFYCGILASSDGSTTRTIEARHCVFNNNANGIILEQVNNATVLYNDFHIGANEIDGEGCTTASGLGLFIDNATGFAVEGNSFDKATGAPLGNYMGIRLLYPIGTTNVIDLNEFEGLSYGVYCQGVKFQTQTWQGLSLLCNDNVDNYADFYGIDGGLQINQGTPSLPAGNTFSQYQGTTWHFYSGEDQLVYYYCTSCTNEEPDNYKIEHITKNGLSNSNLCVSAYYGDDNSGKDKMSVLTEDEQQLAAQEYTSSAQQYDNVKVLYDNLKDGGDTDAELMDVQTAQSGDTWTLRSQLLGHSPHLSMKVLKETSDRTDIFSDSHLFDILSANPDELKKGELISYLENKEEPLPGYMVSILKQLAEGGTYKTVLEEQLSSHTRGKNRHATAMLRSILHDSIRDYNQMRLWLDKLGGIDADRQIVASYVQQGDFSSAQGLSAMIPALYGLEGRELEEHGYYGDILDLHQNLSQQGRSIFQLDTTELQLLRFIADTSKGVAATQARAILRNVAGDDFYNCPCINGNAAFKDNAVWPAQSLNTALKVSVSPVPAHDWVNFEYSLPSGLLNAELSVYQPGGKLLKNMELNGQQGQYTLDLRNMETGLYFYSLKSGSYIKSGKFLLSR